MMAVQGGNKDSLPMANRWECLAAIRPGNCDGKVRFIFSGVSLDCVISVRPAPMDGLYAHDLWVCSTLFPEPD
jgi:hypothetical protein